MATNIAAEFIAKAVRELMDMLGTLKSAISHGDKQSSVVGAMLNKTNQEGYRKADEVVKKGTDETVKLAEEIQGLTIEKPGSSGPAAGNS